MLFTEYAAGQGQLAILENGVFLVDGTKPALTPLAGDRLEVHNKGLVLSWPLRLVDINSVWKAHMRANRGIEDKVNNAAKEVIAQPLKLVQEIKIGATLNIDGNYIKAVKMLLFEFGNYFIERSTAELLQAVKGAGEVKDESLLSLLESKLGAEEVAISPAKLRGLLENFIEVMKEKPLEPFSSAFGKKTTAWLGGSRGVFVDRTYGFKLEPKQGDQPDAEKVIYVGGVAYVPAEKPSLWQISGIDSAFSEYESQFVRAQGIARAGERLGQVDAGMSRRELGILAAALKKGIDNVTLDFGKFGIILKPSDITVYLNVPKHALRDWARPFPARYYLFPESKVAIKIHKNASGDFVRAGRSNPFILGDGFSPFIYSGHGRDSEICMGSFREDSTHLLRGLSFPAELAKHLNEAYKIVTAGYRKGAQHFGHVGRDGLQQYTQKSLDELSVMGVPVTNEE